MEFGLKGGLKFLEIALLLALIWLHALLQLMLLNTNVSKTTRDGHGI